MAELPDRTVRRTVVVDGLETAYLEAGSGPPVLLLHSGEFGSSAELSWEHTIEALAINHRVIAPDWLGYGASAKVHDFTSGTARMLIHMGRFCAALGLTDLPVVGNSMGASLLLADAAQRRPQLPASAIVAICGGGDVLSNEHVNALYDYDCTVEAMQRLLIALFHTAGFADNATYLERRHRLSLEPGAWECVAAARFRAPTTPRPQSRTKPGYESIGVPTLIVEAAHDKLKPTGWAKAVADRIPGAATTVVPDAGHCPQLEQPQLVNDLLLDFLA